MIITLISALAEILTLGAVFPFIGVITNSDKVFEYPLIGKLIKYLNIESEKDLIFFITYSFAGLAFIAGLIRITVLWVTTRLAFSSGAELSIETYRRALFQPYKVHIHRNSSEVISAILIKINDTINWVVLPILWTASAILVLISMVVTLLIINFKISVITIFSFWFMYFIFSTISRKKLAVYSSIISKEQNQITKALQEGFGGIRDVILNGQQLVFNEIYAKSDYPLRRAQGNTKLISTIPRYILEAFGLIFIAILAYFLNQNNIGGTFALQTLGIIALSAQRLLPLLQQIYSARIHILAHESILTDVIQLLYMEVPDTNQRKLLNNLIFHKYIKFKNVSFKYVEDGPTILNNVNFTINKGSRVGFIGPTGSGKSTVVDILMGLLRPNSGVVSIDDIKLSGENINDWQSKICHVLKVFF